MKSVYQFGIVFHQQNQSIDRQASVQRNWEWRVLWRLTTAIYTVLAPGIIVVLFLNSYIALAKTTITSDNEDMALLTLSETAKPTIGLTHTTFLPVVLVPNPVIEIFENDFNQWSNVVGATINTIDFESIEASSAPVEIIGNEFASLALNPNFTLVDGGGIFVGNPSTGQTLTPTSGENMLFPECNPACEGIINITFDQDVRSFGAFFIDVEADFSTTGFSLSPGSISPEIAFSSFQGQNAQSFLGFISDTPFSSIDIHFATGSNIDGTLIDDLVYSTSPVSIIDASWR